MSIRKAGIDIKLINLINTNIMKIITSIIASLVLAGSVFAGCPSKAIKGKFVSFDEDSKKLVYKKGKNEKSVTIGSGTKMIDFKSISDLTDKDMIEIHGCNCSNKTATKVAKLSKQSKDKES